MSAFTDILRVEFTTSLALHLQYRASMLVWMVGAVLEPVIYLIVWSTVAEQQGGTVSGMSAGDFSAYFITTMALSRLTFNWLNWVYEEYVRDGTLAARLVRPVHPLVHDAMENLSYKFVTILIIVPIALALAWLFEAHFELRWWSSLATVPALLLAYTLRFSVEWGVALIAFWTTRMRAINNMYFVSLLFFSGMIAPLTLFPPAVTAVGNLLPFRWFIYFPAQLFLGQLAPVDAVRGMGMQLVWLLMTWAGLRVLWQRAVRRFGAVGG